MDAAKRSTAAARNWSRWICVSTVALLLDAGAATAQKAVKPPEPPKQLIPDIDATIPDQTPSVLPSAKTSRLAEANKEATEDLWVPVLPKGLAVQPPPKPKPTPDDDLWMPVPTLPRKLTTAPEPTAPIAKEEKKAEQPLLTKALKSETAAKKKVEADKASPPAAASSPDEPAGGKPRPLPQRDPVADVKAKDTKAGAAPSREQAYRPLAAIVAQQEDKTTGTPNVWISHAPQMPPATPNAIITKAPDGYMGGVVEEYSDATSESLWWSDSLCFKTLPGTLLWEPPLVGQREPRPYFKATSLNDVATYDVALGGQWGLARWQPAGTCREGLQIDLFGAAFTRFNRNGQRLATDYRAGIPLTYAKGPWQFKLAYEHTTSREDELAGRNRLDRDRDEAVLGIGYRWFGQVRTYGQAGYAFAATGPASDKRARFGVGVEWSEQCSTGASGQPFSALNVEFHEDRDYDSEITLQVGWQWKSEPTGRSARLAVEYYTGRSPFDVFYLAREQWFGFAASWDW